MDSPLHITIDSESMEVDSTSTTIDEKDEVPFRNLGPSIFGHIVDYSSSKNDEGEVEQRLKEEEVRVFKEKSEVDRFKDTWKSVMHESMFMPQLKKIVTEFDKACFQYETNEPFVTLIVAITPLVAVAVASTSTHLDDEVDV